MEELQQLPLPLLIWYRENARSLPWREEVSPYHTWVSEIMLQQTRVAAVLDYYHRFLDVLPTVETLANCPDDQLMKLWQGLGYYSRARNLKKGAIQVMEEYGGEIPADFQSIRRLSGIGDYTAGAISSIAFGLPHPAVDGNVLRVVARITGDEGDISTATTKKRVTEALYQVLPVDCPGDFNQAMMELGATICLPNGAPLCDRCPARGFCVALATDKTATLPVKAPKKPRRVEHRQVYLLFCENRVALRQRGEKGLLAGLWEFPNGLVGEEIYPHPTDKVGTGKHIFTHIEWHMTAWSGEISADTLPCDWVLADRRQLVEQYAIPNAFSSFLHIIEEKLGHF